LEWVHDHALEFQVDPARIGIFGESAGGGLAAATAIMARDRKLNPPLAKQILVYPMLDDRNKKDFGIYNDLVTWKQEDNVTGWSAMLGDRVGADDVEPTAAPARITDASGLPPTYLDVGSFDLFVDENIAYVAKLVAANIEVEFHLYPGLPHGFELVAPGIPVTRMATENRVRAVLNF
jgi:acetyl esterase/lipase